MRFNNFLLRDTHATVPTAGVRRRSSTNSKCVEGGWKNAVERGARISHSLREACPERSRRRGSTCCSMPSRDQVDCVVVEDLSRLSRDPGQLARFSKCAQNHDVRLFGVADGVDHSRPEASLKGHRRT
jgi:hypothetical protein